MLLYSQAGASGSLRQEKPPRRPQRDGGSRTKARRPRQLAGPAVRNQRAARQPAWRRRRLDRQRRRGRRQNRPARPRPPKPCLQSGNQAAARADYKRAIKLLSRAASTCSRRQKRPGGACTVSSMTPPFSVGEIYNQQGRCLVDAAAEYENPKSCRAKAGPVTKEAIKPAERPGRASRDRGDPARAEGPRPKAASSGCPRATHAQGRWRDPHGQRHRRPADRSGTVPMITRPRVARSALACSLCAGVIWLLAPLAQARTHRKRQAPASARPHHPQAKPCGHHRRSARKPARRPAAGRFSKRRELLARLHGAEVRPELLYYPDGCEGAWTRPAGSRSDAALPAGSRS